MSIYNSGYLKIKAKTPIVSLRAAFLSKEIIHKMTQFKLEKGKTAA